ncbi:MAG TPA: helix-turn-helix domain-containing protein [Streptosporangiaceae bacterium]
MPRPSPRGRLLDAAITYVESRGITDLSLRELAAAIGTSHRMLIHHFGSKEELWVEVIRTVELRQRERLAALLPRISADPAADPAGDPAADPAEALRAWWRQISDPALWPNVRLFFEIYGQALQGRRGATALLDGIVDAWVEPAAAAEMARGVPPECARARARLGVAVGRGLLLDLVATGDRAAVDAAMEEWIASYVATM